MDFRATPPHTDDGPTRAIVRTWPAGRGRTG